MVFNAITTFPHCTGDSAGGNLAAAVALKLRDINIQPQPKLQVLIYPITQMVDFMLPSYVRNEWDPLLNKRLMAALWLNYAQGRKWHQKIGIGTMVSNTSQIQVLQI